MVRLRAAAGVSADHNGNSSAGGSQPLPENEVAHTSVQHLLQYLRLPRSGVTLIGLNVVICIVLERLSVAGLLVIGEQFVVAVVERAACEALEPHHLPAQEDAPDSLVAADAPEAVQHATVSPLRGDYPPADRVDRVHHHYCGKHREIGVEPAYQLIIGLHLQRVVDAEVGAPEEKQTQQEDMCALVDAPQSALLDGFGQLLPDGDSAVVHPVRQHLSHILQRVQRKRDDAGRGDAESRVDVEVLSGCEVLVVVEGPLKELLYPEDECLAGQNTQHIGQIALPECAHPFLPLHPQQTVPEALVALLEVAQLHQLGHHLHAEADEIQRVGQRDRPRDEQPGEEGGFDALQRRFFCNSHRADSYQYIKLICGIDPSAAQATPLLPIILVLPCQVRQLRSECPVWVFVNAVLCLSELMVQQQMMEGRLSKREQKHNKILQKELYDLHKDVEEMNRRAGDRHNPDSDSDDGLADRKGKKWWYRFDERHFATPSLQDCLTAREVTTSRRAPLASYSQARILSEYELFAEPALIHVLFAARRPVTLALTSFELEQAIPNYAESKRDREPDPSIRVVPVSPEQPSDPSELREIKLSLAGINEDLDFCRVVEDYKRTLQLFPDKDELERETMLWEQELSAVHRDNSRAWDRLIKAVRHEVRALPASEEEIAGIKEYLMWVTVLKYFQHGHADKTMEMLMALIDSQKAMRPAKSSDSHKKLFQTDCKICFCSFNNDSNQVLYCDNCNTSFHLACYGLQTIPKEEIYYCDCCRYQKKFNYKKPACQLCNKSNFPIKELQGHFYHVTCLLLLNLARITNGSLALREDVNHHRITEMVVANQLQRSECEFCSRQSGSELGYRLKCSFPNCSNSSHPICAYINGCRYSIRRDRHSERLEVRYQCNEHDADRDWQLQTYIRRYMCNLKGTSSKNIEEFRQEFLQSIQKRRENRARKWDVSRIIAKTKMLRSFFKKEENRHSQKEKLDTESGRILEKFYKKGK